MHVARIRKAGDARYDFDAVSRKLRADHVDFGLDDVEGPEREIGHGDRLFHAIVEAVNTLILISGKMQHRFADRLAWDRAGIDRGSADHLQLLDQGGPLSKFSRLNRGALSRRPGTNHDEIVLFHGLPREYIIVAIA